MELAIGVDGAAVTVDDLVAVGVVEETAEVGDDPLSRCDIQSERCPGTRGGYQPVEKIGLEFLDDARTRRLEVEVLHLPRIGLQIVQLAKAVGYSSANISGGQ